MNTPEIKEFIMENQDIFWYVRRDALENLSHESLVEGILNFGDMDSLRKLFNLLGIENVAKIFYKQVNRRRVNYFPKTVNYFKLFFEHYVPEHSYSKTTGDTPFN